MINPEPKILSHSSSVIFRTGISQEPYKGLGGGIVIINSLP